MARRSTSRKTSRPSARRNDAAARSKAKRKRLTPAPKGAKAGTIFSCDDEFVGRKVTGRDYSGTVLGCSTAPEGKRGRHLVVGRLAPAASVRRTIADREKRVKHARFVETFGAGGVESPRARSLGYGAGSPDPIRVRATLASIPPSRLPSPPYWMPATTPTAHGDGTWSPRINQHYSLRSLYFPKMKLAAIAKDIRSGIIDAITQRFLPHMKFSLTLEGPKSRRLLLDVDSVRGFHLAIVEGDNESGYRARLTEDGEVFERRLRAVVNQWNIEPGSRQNKEVYFVDIINGAYATERNFLRSRISGEPMLDLTLSEAIGEATDFRDVALGHRFGVYVIEPERRYLVRIARREGREDIPVAEREVSSPEEAQDFVAHITPTLRTTFHDRTNGSRAARQVFSKRRSRSR